MSDPSSLPDGDWVLEGQLLEASNVVLRLIGADGTRGVYKAEKGERPLADFPTPSLAHREVATYLVARAGGWTNVPETRWYDGELGPGSLQRWVGPLEPEDQHLVVLEELGEWNEQSHPHAIAAFEGEDDVEFILVHTDDGALRDIAALDIILNNADRKGSHLIAVNDEVYAIDNGLSFHAEEKLRTVLWGFAGNPLTNGIMLRLKRLIAQQDSLTDALRSHVTDEEILNFWARVEALHQAGTFPMPPQDRYGLPWPPV